MDSNKTGKIRTDTFFADKDFLVQGKPISESKCGLDKWKIAGRINISMYFLRNMLTVLFLGNYLQSHILSDRYI